MSSVSLKHIFGLKGDVKDNIHYIDETNVLYPAGYNIVLYNTEKKTQKFVPLQPGGTENHATTGEITALAVSGAKSSGGKGKVSTCFVNQHTCT